MTLKKLMGVAVLALLWPAHADRELPPEGGEPRQYKLPNSETINFDNGLRLTMVPFGQIPKVTVSVAVQAGNRDEGDDVWLADLTGEMMIEGAGERDAVALAAAVAEMGGQLGINVGIERTSLNVDVLSEFGADAVALLADVARRPLLPAGELERVRGNMLKNLAIAATRPQTQADEALRKLIFGDHPYGVGLPSSEEFGRFDIDDVRRFHSNNFGARRTHIYVAGRFDRDRIARAVRDHFGDWEAGSAPIRQAPDELGYGKVRLIDRPDAPQSTLFLGIPVVDPSHPDYVPMTVLNTLLGGSFISRITRNIREDKGYTYSPRSRVVSRFKSAYWQQSADVTTNVTGASLTEIFYEIRRLQDEPPPPDELARVQNYRTGTFVLGNATRTGLIGQLQFLDTHGLDRAWLTRFISELNAVTPARISELAKRYLDIDGMSLAVVGDLDTVRPQLEALSEIDLSADADASAGQASGKGL